MGDHNLVSHTLLRVFITIIIMSSKTIILLFGILAFVAIAAAMSDDYDDTEIEEVSFERVAREADPGREKKRAGKKGKKLKKKRKNKNKDRKRMKGNRKVAKKNQMKERKEDDKSTCFGCRTVSANCLTQAISLMKYWKDIVTNFEKQSKRIASQSKTGGRKADKKGVFSSIALNLVDIGGGNKSSLSCGGSTSNSGAKQLKNLTDTLFACEVNINASCNSANLTTFTTRHYLMNVQLLLLTSRKWLVNALKRTSDTTGT